MIETVYPLKPTFFYDYITTDKSNFKVLKITYST